MMNKQASCEERVGSWRDGRLEDLRLLWLAYTQADCPLCDGVGDDDNGHECPLCKGNGTLGDGEGNIEELGNMNEYGLSFDYVSPDECDQCAGLGEVVINCETCHGSGEDENGEECPECEGDSTRIETCDKCDGEEEEGYFRYQLSWGGPSDEFRIFALKESDEWNLYRIEYWFMDWFDGASRRLTGEDYDLIEEIFKGFFVDSGSADHQYNEAMDDI
jgi:DnaJ-class molecular chaperone